MKTLNYFLLTLYIVAFYSCNKNDDNSFKEVETELELSIPVSSNSSGLKFQLDELKERIPFSGTNNYQLNDLVDNSNAIVNINRITPLVGCVLEIPNIKDEYEISSLMLNWGQKTAIDEEYKMLESIDLMTLNHDLKDGVLKFDLDAVAKQMFAEISNPKAMLLFSITGECNYSFNSLAKLQIPVFIESEFYTPGFALF